MTKKIDYVVGVDLGGTKVEACLMDLEKNILSRCRRPVEASLGQERVMENIRGVIAEAAGGRTYGAVGMGTPGTYIHSRDRLYGSPHTPVYENPGFIRQLRDMLTVPLVVENDANCLALGEYFSFYADSYDYVMAVILGTGFGTGLILDKKLYRGARGGAAEIGHTTIDFNGRLCQCGRRGCVEAYLSGPSLVRRFRELDPQTPPLHPPDLYRLYKTGDPRAVKLFEESARLMGEVFANAVNTLDLEALILGGGVSNIPLWYEKVPAYLKKLSFGIPRNEIPILPARLGDSAGVIGAAFLALRQLGALSF